MVRGESPVWTGAKVGGITGSLLTGIANLIEQYHRPQPFNWRECLHATAKGAFIGAGVGAGAGAIYGFLNPPQTCIEDEYLHKILKINALELDDADEQSALELREALCCMLQDRYDESLATAPFYSGSVPNGLANKGKADYDMVLPFEKDGNTISNMYQMVLRDLKKWAAKTPGVRIRAQRRSIGVIWQGHHFDVVPGRVIGDYSTNQDLMLRDKPRRKGSIESHIKTNLKKHAVTLEGKTEEKLVIRLLKLYRDNQELPISSIILKEWTLEAFEKYEMYDSLIDNFLGVMEYIISQLSFRKRLLDPANSNNNLLKKLSDDDKKAIAAVMSSDFACIENNPDCLQELFE